jgi:hypothetical protein
MVPGVRRAPSASDNEKPRPDGSRRGRLGIENHEETLRKASSEPYPSRQLMPTKNFNHSTGERLAAPRIIRPCRSLPNRHFHGKTPRPQSRPSLGPFPFGEGSCPKTPSSARSSPKTSTPPESMPRSISSATRKAATRPKSKAGANCNLIKPRLMPRAGNVHLPRATLSRLSVTGTTAAGLPTGEKVKKPAAMVHALKL